MEWGTAPQHKNESLGSHNGILGERLLLYGSRHYRGRRNTNRRSCALRHQPLQFFGFCVWRHLRFGVWLWGDHLFEDLREKAWNGARH